MKRDMELVRKILLEMEKWAPDQRGQDIRIEGRTAEEVAYHVGLMNQARLIKALDASSFQGEAWIAVKILWDGHAFLDAARSDTIWAHAKQRALSTTGTLTLEALKAALQWVVKQAVLGG